MTSKRQMSNKMKLGLIVMAFSMLCLANSECEDTNKLPIITPGDGQVRDTIIDANSAIRDAATEVKDVVESTGEGLEVETHGTVILDKVWDIAKAIAEGE